MSYTNVPIAAAGDWIDDAYINTYLGDNLRAIFSSLTGAGQLLASTAISSLSKVPVTGNNGYLLTEDTTQATKMKFAAPPIGLPAGGTALQYSRKNAANNGYEWATLPADELPAGGTALQYLRKDAANTGKEWATFPANELPAGGSALQGLRKNAANNAVEWAALLNVINRQGGSTTVWNTPGTGTRSVASAATQVGIVTVAMSGSPAYGTQAITFPTAFSNNPLVLVSAKSVLSSGVNVVVTYGGISTTGFTIYVDYNASSGSYGNIDITWIAIGPP